MKRNFMFVLLGVLALSAGPIGAQTDKIQKEVDKKLGKIREEQKAESLAAMIQQALKNNPDIRVAEAKVREAQVELERTRLQVVGDLSALLADIAAAEAASSECRERNRRVEQLYNKGAVPKEELGAARLAFKKLAAELTAKQARLPFLVGKAIVGDRKEDDKIAAPDQLKADALKNNPDILYAESKVQAVQAALNRTRLQAVAEIGVAHADLDAARAGAFDGRERWVRAKTLFEQGVLPKEDYGAAETARDRLAADVAVKEAKLSYLLGKQPAGFADSIWVDGHALWITRFQDAGTVLSDEDFLRRAMLDLQGRGPTVEEMKAFLKMPEKDRRTKWVDQLKKEDMARVHFMGLNAGCVNCHTPTALAFDPHGRFVVEAHWRQLFNHGTPMTDKLRSALDAPVSINLDNTKPKAAMEYVRDQLLPGINLHVRMKSWKKETIDVKLPQRVPAGAVLQFLEDELDVVFVLREYGVVVVAAEEKLPPGAVRLIDFWKHGKTLEPATTPKEKTPPPKSKTAAPAGVRGVIVDVDPKDALLVQISIGSDAGLAKGQMLDVFRLQPEAKFLVGRLQVVDVMPTRSVARFVTTFVNASSLPHVGDQVVSMLATK